MNNDLDTIEKLNHDERKARAQRAKDAHIEKLCKEYVEKNKEQVTRWIERNPNQRLPLVYDETTGRIVWLTRKMRRRIAKGRA